MNVTWRCTITIYIRPPAASKLAEGALICTIRRRPVHPLRLQILLRLWTRPPIHITYLRLEFIGYTTAVPFTLAPRSN